MSLPYGDDDLDPERDLNLDFGEACDIAEARIRWRYHHHPARPRHRPAMSEPRRCACGPVHQVACRWNPAMIFRSQVEALRYAVDHRERIPSYLPPALASLKLPYPAPGEPWPQETLAWLEWAEAELGNC